MNSLPTSSFSHLDVLPPDSVYSLKELYAADKSENKIILGSGVYRDDNSKLWVLPVVQKAEKLVDETQDTDRYDYLPIMGYAPFHDAARELLFGPLGKENVDRMCSMHTVSGTGANNLGARFLKETLKPGFVVWMSDPTWVNHENIWTLAGVEVRSYPYWDPVRRGLAFGNMMDLLEREARKGDVILLHACAHNPTGVDPTKAQWREIADLCQRKGLFPFFDCAYLGFATGDLDEDAWAIRHFLSRDTLELAVAQSFSKNMGLYGERVGAFHLWTASSDAAGKAKSHLSKVQRATVSTPSTRGAKVAATIMLDATLFEEWAADMRVMSSRIKTMRHKMRDELVGRGVPGDWNHITSQIGMFSFTGLTEDQVASIQAESHVYMHKSGRISVAGLTTKNVAYVAGAVEAAVRSSMNATQIGPDA